MSKLPQTKGGEIDYSKDFFGKPAYLTVSGQVPPRPAPRRRWPRLCDDTAACRDVDKARAV